MREKYTKIGTLDHVSLKVTGGQFNPYAGVQMITNNV